jgi:hypothetical protein
MLDFKFLRRLAGKPVSCSSDRAAGDQATPPVTKILETKRGVTLGCRLAFSLGQDYVAMAAVRHVGKWRNLLDLQSVAIPAELEDPKARTDFISDTVTKFASQHGRWSPNVSISVSGWETAYRSFLLPVLPKKDLAAAVLFEARKQLPFPEDSCVYDHRPIARIDSQGTSKYQICLQAATLRLINGLLEPFKAADIAVNQIDTGPEVMGELLKCLKTYRSDTNYTMVELTPDRSIISFYQDGSLVFSFVGSAGAKSISGQPTEPALDNFAESLIDEIQVSQDYFSGQRAQSATNQVLIYGSIQPSDALLKQLNGRSSLEFAWFPIEELDLPSTAFTDSENTLTALPALASAMNASRTANLLPEEHRATLRERKLCRWSQIAAATLVIGLGLGYWAAHAKQSLTHEHVTRIENELATLKASDAYGRYHVIKRQIVSDQMYLDQAQRQLSYFYLGLKELSRLSVPEITLDNLTYGVNTEDSQLLITGRASSSTIPPEVVLAEYVESLRASKLCTEVEVKRYVKRKTKGQFEIKFTIGLETTIS